MSMKLAREKASQAWCQPKTKNTVMNPDLAEEFAIILNKAMDEPRLGLATTGQIIDELRARCEVDGTINYRTVGGIVSNKAISADPEQLADEIYHAVNAGACIDEIEEMLSRGR